MNDFIHEHLATQSPDILLLQETWLLNKDLSKLNHLHSGYQGRGVSGVLENGEILRGRPYGGLAVVYSKSLASAIHTSNTGSARVYEAVLTLQDKTKVLLINVYLPCDNRLINTVDPMLQECYDVIEQCIEAFDGEHIIIAGDFNVDRTQNNAHSNLLNEFVSLKRLLFSAEKFPSAQNDYTFYRTGMQRGSHIDHILISQSLEPYVAGYKIEHSPVNPSCHQPVTINLKLPAAKTDSCNIASDSASIAWHKVTENMLDCFRNVVDASLTTVMKDTWNVLECNVAGCDDQSHKLELDALLAMMCDSAIEAGESIFPKKHKSLSKPRWREEVKPIRDRAMVWHNVWRDAGRPLSGILFDLRQKTRREYHQAVRKLKNREKDYRKCRMAEHVATNDNRGLWSEIKKVQQVHKASPASVDGNASPQDIANSFGRKYKVLYNSVLPNQAALDNLHTTLQADMISNQTHECVVTEDDINRAINKIKEGKNDGDIGFVSNYIVHSSVLWRRVLARLVTQMLSHGHNPEVLLRSSIVSIPKDTRGNLSASDNYRGISLFNGINKVIDWIILQKYSDKLTTHNLQFGFKQHHSTSLCTAVLKDVASHYISHGSKVYACLIDASKAFDRVRHDILFKLLTDRHLPPLVVNFLMDGYSRQRVRASWEGCHSEEFGAANGIRQGGVLSPILFNVYIDELIKDLEASGYGCHVGHLFYGALGYADDLSLLAPSIYGLKKMLQICEEFGMKCDVMFNPKKTVCICFSKKKQVQLPTIKFNNVVLKWANEVNHLGNRLQSDLKDSRDIQFKRKELVSSANSILAHFKYVSTSVKKTLFRSYCCVFYGSQSWDLTGNSAALKELEITWRKAGRAVLGVPYRTRSHLVPHLLDQVDLHVQLRNRFDKMIKNCNKSNNVYVKYLIDHSKQTQGHFGRNIYNICVPNNISIEHYAQATAAKDLMDLRDGISYIDFLTKSEIDELLNFVCTY